MSESHGTWRRRTLGAGSWMEQRAEQRVTQRNEDDRERDRAMRHGPGWRELPDEPPPGWPGGDDE